MEMPACNRKRETGSPRKGPSAGFTLIELMVVLALLSLLTLLAAPNLQRLYDSVTLRSERSLILDQFAAIGREAMLRSKAYMVLGTTGDLPRAVDAPPQTGEFEPFPLQLPEGWSVRLDRPLLVRENGVCLGADVTLLHRDETAASLTLEAPFCRVDAES